MVKKIANECVSHFKNNPFFKNTVILYVLTGCIIFFLFGIITIFGFSKASTSQMNATEQKMLEQSCNTANLILRDIHSLANNKFSEDSSIREAMTLPFDNRRSINVQNAFSEIMASSKLIDSIYVINYKNKIVYSSQTNVRTIDNFFDKDILKYIEETEAKSDIYFPRSTDISPNGIDTVHMDYITSIYRNTKDYAFIINIDQAKFQELVNLQSGMYSYQTMVLDSDGKVISHSTPEYFSEDLSTTAPFDRIVNGESPSGSFRFKGKIVNFVRSDNLGYMYISICSVGAPLGNFKSFLIYMLLFTVLLVVVYLVCSVLASLSTYSLFNNLKKSIYKLFNKDEAGEPLGNEIENISKLLSEVKNNYTSMETIQYQFINSKQNATLKKLLIGTFAYLQDDMDRYDISFPYNSFAVVIVQIDGISKMDSDTIYTIKYAVMNMGKEIFESNSKVYVSEVNEYDVTFILNFTDSEFIEPSIIKLNGYINKFFEASVCAAYDTAQSDSLEDISVLYHNAKHAAPYKITYGNGSIISYESIKELDNAVSSYPETLEQDIIKSITAQNQDDLKVAVSQFMRVLYQTSYNLIIMYANRLLLAVEQFSVRSNIADDSFVPTDMQQIISEFETLDTLESFIVSHCQNIMLKLSTAKFDSKKDIMVKTVLAYIEENYTDPNLSIDMIAEKINRSANYTRSMFKQNQGISISDYIAKKRFDEVCRRLIETNLTAQEIGASLGLNSGSYFYTSFKKHTGYTPDQYRKMHKSV